jgi:hypothetical protein
VYFQLEKTFLPSIFFFFKRFRPYPDAADAAAASAKCSLQRASPCRQIEEHEHEEEAALTAPAVGPQLREAILSQLDDGKPEDHVWFEDRWMVASLCDE